MSRIDKERWENLWVRFTGQHDCSATHQKLLAAYGEPHRIYHTSNHLVDCLILFDRVKQLARRPAEVEVALWFHDAVYDLYRADNEEKSALWATEILLINGLDREVSDRVGELIMATSLFNIPKTEDAKLIIDIDLAILGRSTSDYELYEQKIRQEYGRVPQSEFNLKRSALLEAFLTRPTIYYTKRFQDTFENQARINISRAIQKLKDYD
ncbi:N-methyl-D-aspartate receptor NMDAR2C subunit [candidate division CSSED10-310 bacterium]|uniref:N-methyl-D-aspartate receptor NMDAR2C subunit n=1 Tax=candidate division CSSED10-310 bacterium TaxID=2855610 RepID=A0ABV6Z6R8_UNCC1